jgi:hypothetical protein
MKHVETSADVGQAFAKDKASNAAQEHATLLHPQGGRGLVTVAYIDPTEEEYENRWKQRIYSVNELHEAVGEYAGRENVWVSMNRFRGGRKVANLRHLCALYSDCDFYKISTLAGKGPSFAAEYASEQLRLAGIPDPSLVVSSGQGLQLVWFLEPVPAQALPRWTAIQKCIHEALEPVGADAVSKDAARVFRLTGTVHGKSGNVVEIVGGDGTVWNFDDLAAEVLPLSRDDVAGLRDLRIQRAKKKRSKAPTNSSKGQRGNLEGTRPSHVGGAAYRRPANSALRTIPEREDGRSSGPMALAHERRDVAHHPSRRP